MNPHGHGKLPVGGGDKPKENQKGRMTDVKYYGTGWVGRADVRPILQVDGQICLAL